VPAWVRAGLPGLPATMAAGGKRAGAVDRAVVDLVETLLLADRVGERFDAVVIDERLVQLRDPAVRGPVERDCPEPGSDVTVRVERADPATRKVSFSVAA
nr:RNB domain-containing ribonuclease [Actinomycetota bacterium]